MKVFKEVKDSYPDLNFSFFFFLNNIVLQKKKVVGELFARSMQQYR